MTSNDKPSDDETMAEMFGPPQEDFGEQMALGMATMLAHFSTAMHPVVEALVGYRTSLMDMGIPEEIANQCLPEYHAMLMKNVTNAMSRPRA